MKARLEIGEQTVPRLPSHAKLRHDKAREQWVVQAPERVFVLDPTALEIVKRCDGKATVGAIVDELAAQYNAPRDVILKDVNAMLQELADKGVMAA